MSTDSVGVQTDYPRADAGIRPERAFNTAILVSAVRCTLTYVIFPFVAPALSLAPGLGPTVGIAVGVVAIVANLFSIRRFRASTHRLRRPMILINLAVIGLLVVLVAVDVVALVG